MGRPMTTLDWLSQHCNPDREAIAKPFLVDGWACATEGHYLIAVKTDLVLPFPSTDGIKRQVAILLTQVHPTIHTVSLAALKAWAGNTDLEPRECPECNGDTTVTCNMEFEHPCGDCGGSGVVTRAMVRKGVFYGRGIDRTLVARVLDQMPGENVTIGLPDRASDHLTFDGSEYRGLVMPMGLSGCKLGEALEWQAKEAP